MSSIICGRDLIQFSNLLFESSLLSQFLVSGVVQTLGEFNKWFWITQVVCSIDHGFLILLLSLSFAVFLSECGEIRSKSSQKYENIKKFIKMTYIFEQKQKLSGAHVRELKLSRILIGNANGNLSAFSIHRVTLIIRTMVVITSHLLLVSCEDTFGSNPII